MGAEPLELRGHRGKVGLAAHAHEHTYGAACARYPRELDG